MVVTRALDFVWNFVSQLFREGLPIALTGAIPTVLAAQSNLLPFDARLVANQTMMAEIVPSWPIATKGANAVREYVWRLAAEKPDHRECRLLRAGRERACGHRTAE